MQSTLILPNQQHRNESKAQFKNESQRAQLKKQEWALIYNQQAQQFKKSKQVQKIMNKQRQQQFKSQIEQQIYSKNSQQKNEREEDKKFSDYMKNKAQQDEQRQKAERLKKLIQRRRIEQQNYQKAENIKSSSRVRQNYRVGLDIGQKTKEDVIRQHNALQKNLIDALDKQLKMKEEEKITQKIMDEKVHENNQRYMSQYYKKRDSVGPRRKQNEDVYYQFQRINQQKIMRQRQLQRKIVDEANLKKRQQQFRRQEQKRMKRQFLSNQVKKTLDDQIKYRSEQNLNQKKYNPEQNSYQIIRGIFRDKRSSYDKKQYSDYLAQQAEQQRYRKKKWDYMDDRQYRLNMNQLNKAVTGNYEHDYYIDRTVNAIGQNKLRGASSMSLDLGHLKANHEEDLMPVKFKLDQIRRSDHENPNRNYSSSLFNNN